MKHLWFSFLLFIPLLAWGNVDLLELKTDKLSYQEYEKALLVTKVASWPVNSNLEVVVKNSMNGVEVESVKVRERLYLSRIDNIGSQGHVVFKSEYFLRDKLKASKYEEAILNSEINIRELQRSLRVLSGVEADEVVQLIEQEEERIQYFSKRLDVLLRFVSQKELAVEVFPASNKYHGAFLFLDPHRDPGIYFPGEKMRLFAHVYLRMKGKDVYIKAKVGEKDLNVDEFINDEFLIQSDELTVEEVGEHEVRVELYIRDALRSQRLEEALWNLHQEAKDLTLKIESEVDPTRISKFQHDLDDIERMVAHIQGILSQMGEYVETSIYRYIVEVNP